MKKSKKKAKKLNKFQSLFDYKCLFYDFVKITGFIPAMLFFRFKYYFINKDMKKEFKKQPCIIVSNHQSFLDPFIMVSAYWYKRIGIVATKDLFSTKFKEFLFKSFGCICVDKENVSMKTFKEINNRISRGHSIGVFPEGTVIHKDDNLDAFKSGVIMMAIMSKTCIYPTYTVKRPHWWNRQRIIIGDKFNVFDYIKTPMPSIAQIEEVCKKLEEKTKELERLSKEY